MVIGGFLVGVAWDAFLTFFCPVLASCNDSDNDSDNGEKTERERTRGAKRSRRETGDQKREWNGGSRRATACSTRAAKVGRRETPTPMRQPVKIGASESDEGESGRKTRKNRTQPEFGFSANRCKNSPKKPVFCRRKYCHIYIYWY